MSRLAAIKICGYRGFPQPVTVWLSSHDGNAKPTGPGKNLVLYGENGSGKSSLGKALRDFLDLTAAAPKFDDFRYRFAEPPRTDRSITLAFDDPSIDPLTWNPTDRDTAHREFTDMARARAWLDYRRVWRISEVEYGDSVQIFRQLVEDILPSCPMGTTGGTFGKAWAEISAMAAQKPRRVHGEKPLLHRLLEAIKRFNDHAKTFVPQVEGHANEMLRAFSPWSSMTLRWERDAKYDSSSHYNKFQYGSVSLRMHDKGGDPLKKPSEFINEARVTAIGLCLYLAGMSLSIPPRRTDGSRYPRLLVLDDVLLSLDMVHRLPLLKLLKSKAFKDWQIILLTHDRAWYEIARQQLGGECWAHCELFAQRVGDYEQPLVRVEQDHLLQAIDFLEAGHIKAAAVHVRTKFEDVLKSACAELRLPVKYHPDPRKVSARDLWNAVCAATWEDIPPVEGAWDSKRQLRWWQPPPAVRPVVPSGLKTRIGHALSWVMNPLSHSQNVDRYRPEIEDAIFAVDELEQAIQRATIMRQAGPLMLREMLLTLLVSRPA